MKNIKSKKEGNNEIVREIEKGFNKIVCSQNLHRKFSVKKEKQERQYNRS